MSDKWMDWAIELQALAQDGIAYSQNPYDIDRFKRIREISAEIVAAKTDNDLEHVRDVFLNEKGYQTPKLCTRAAVFRDGGNLPLVKHGAVLVEISDFYSGAAEVNAEAVFHMRASLVEYQVNRTEG